MTGFEAGEVVELSPQAPEFEQGDRLGTVVSVEKANLRVGLHTTGRIRSVPAAMVARYEDEPVTPAGNDQTSGSATT